MVSRFQDIGAEFTQISRKKTKRFCRARPASGVRGGTVEISDLLAIPRKIPRRPDDPRNDLVEHYLGHSRNNPRRWQIIIHSLLAP
jgi:hypothetical protein